MINTIFNNRKFLFISFLFLILISWPLYYWYYSGLLGTFFEIDPDVVYVSEAISFLNLRGIHYSDHPGTPAILLLSLITSPIYFFTKLKREPAIDWIFQNFDFVVHWARFFGILICSSGITLWTLAFYRITKNFGITLLFFSFIVIYPKRLNMELNLNNEIFGIFFSGIWFFAYSNYFRDTSIRGLFLLSILSGVVIAVKFTYFAIVGATLIIILLDVKRFTLGKRQSFKNIGICISMIIFAFFASIIPVWYKLPSLYSWVIALATHDDMYGSGKEVFFSTKNFITLKQFLITHSIISISISVLTTLVLIAYLLKKISKTSMLIVVATWIPFLIFSKFGQLRYEMINFFIIIAFSLIATNQLFANSNRWVKSLTPILISLFILNYDQRLLFFTWDLIKKEITTTQSFQSFLIRESKNKGSLFGNGNSKEFAYLFSNDWSDGLFTKQLENIEPKIFIFAPPYYKNLKKPNSDRVNVFEVCWENLYFNNRTVGEFKAYYKEAIFVETKIQNTDLVQLKSDHCNKIN
jgi:hypothetical protein